EAVDPVHRVLPALELERGREELPAEPLRLELGRDGVHARDLVLEVGVADYHPLEAVRVGLAIELRALRRRDSLQELLDLLVGGGELACRQRLEDDRADACRLERALGLERDRRRADREEPLGGRRLQLLAPEEDVAQAQATAAARAQALPRRRPRRSPSLRRRPPRLPPSASRARSRPAMTPRSARARDRAASGHPLPGPRAHPCSSARRSRRRAPASPRSCSSRARSRGPCRSSRGRCPSPPRPRAPAPRRPSTAP